MDRVSKSILKQLLPTLAVGVGISLAFIISMRVLGINAAWQVIVFFTVINLVISTIRKKFNIKTFIKSTIITTVIVLLLYYFQEWGLVGSLVMFTGIITFYWYKNKNRILSHAETIVEKAMEDSEDD